MFSIIRIFTGKRSISHASTVKTNNDILEKVLNDERKFAYITDIPDIEENWLDCKECNWYKSKETILSEGRNFIIKISFERHSDIYRKPTVAGRASRSFLSMRN